MEKQQDLFTLLSSINVNDKTEKKNNLTYLSWAWAWSVFKKNVPSATYEVVHYDGKPYLFDPRLGYMVSTIITTDTMSIPMHLPVLDGANKAMTDKPYTYKGSAWIKGVKTEVDKKVEQATMFDINTAIMRCLTKNIALFGLGIYIYAGEDLPETNTLNNNLFAHIPDSKPAVSMDERKLKAFESFKSLNATAEVLSYLVKDRKMAYTNLEDFVMGESIDVVSEIYKKFKNVG